MNEPTLWYELLVNPEACCMKWANEADFVMPVLTPKFMHEIHHGSAVEGEDGGLLPVAPQLNRFLYTLMRARYGHDSKFSSSKEPHKH